MLTSKLGGSNGVKQLLDLLSDAGKIKALIVDMVNKEKAVQDKLDEIYQAESAAKFHANIVKANEKVIARAEKLMVDAHAALDENVKRSNELDNREKEFNEHIDEQVSELAKREVVMNTHKKDLLTLSASLDARARVIDDDAVVVLEMRQEYEAKLAELKSKFEGLSN